MAVDDLSAEFKVQAGMSGNNFQTCSAEQSGCHAITYLTIGTYQPFTHALLTPKFVGCTTNIRTGRPCKLVTFNDMPGCRVAVWRSSTFLEKIATMEHLSGQHPAVLVTFLWFSKPPHSCTEGMFHSFKHPP